MTDRELLEAAAKAASLVVLAYVEGYDDYYWKGPTTGLQIEGANGVWNPLEDDGDALRLAVKLRLELRPDMGSQDGVIAVAGNGVWEEVHAGKDADQGAREDCTRRAIVRAAAAIGGRIELRT